MPAFIVGESKTAQAVFTKGGQPGRITSVPNWGSTNSAVATVTPSADGMTAVIAFVAPGDAQITMNAAAGEATLTAPPLDVHVDLPLADAAAIVLA